MEQFYAVLNQVLIFLIIMIIGFVSVKTKLLPDSALPGISRLFTRIIVPFIVFVNLVNGATRADMREHFYLVGVYACLFVALIAISRIKPKLIGIRGDRSPLFSLAMSFGNIGFIGIPLLLSVFGQGVMIIVTMYYVVDQILFWTYGLTLTYAAANRPKFTPKTLKNMINPSLIAVILAVMVVLFNIRLPRIVDSAFSSISISGMALPLIYLGALLATLDIKDLLKSYSAYAAILSKMIIIPICAFLALRAIGLSPEIVAASTLLLGLPVIGMLPMLASANGSDAEYATVLVLVMTLACVITLPLVSYVTALI